MTKHKQFKKSEKAKIKLNLKGAKLPKGLNVTKTEFKVKKIQIREQLIDTYNTDGTVIRKQNVKELLTKLQHHNATYRNEGLRYLKEQLATYPTETHRHFGAIVLGLAQLSLDAEHDVRKEGSRALAILLATSSADAVAPFFETLSSFVRCAMTHIQPAVQEDALHMLDTLLAHVPALVAGHSDRIFQSFLDMISRLRTEARPERTVSVHLGGKQTSVRWRSKVLDRLLGMLRAMVDAKRAAGAGRPASRPAETQNDREIAFDAPDGGDGSGTQNAAPKSRINRFVAAGKPMYFSVAGGLPNCSLPQLFRKSIGGGGGGGGAAAAAGAQSVGLLASGGAVAPLSFNDEGRRVQHYAELLMPLMFETWMEVRPANFAAEYNEDLVLSNEAAHALKTILEIVECLHWLIGAWDEHMNNGDVADWFGATFAGDFNAQFFVGFPYAQAEGHRSSKRKATKGASDADVQAAGGSKCHPQNLTIAYLFSCLHGNGALVQPAILDAQRVVTYLATVVPTLHAAPADVSGALVRVLRVVLLQNGAEWTRAKVSTRKLLSITMETYQRQRFAKEVRTKALVLLCDVVLDVQLCRSYGDELFTTWLVTLPRMLCQPFVSQHVLTTFACLARQKNLLFLQHLEEAVPSIIENLSAIQVAGIEDQFEGRKLIANLLYWLDDTDRWHGKCTDVLAAQTETVRQYVEQIVHLRALV